MSGASFNHNQIVMNLSLEIGSKLREKGCYAFPSDMRIKVPDYPPYRYPDLTALCGKVEIEKIGVTLSGTDQYVTLPDTILNGLSAATLEMWADWTGNTDWQRLFDFGENGEDMGDQGSFSANASSSYFFFTPRAGTSDSPGCMSTGNRPLVSMTGAGPSMETCILNAPAFPSGMAHVALTIDGSAMRLYLDGAPAGMATPPVSLGSITKSHNCLGRSQYAQDPEFAGSIDEFRIYPTARTAVQISASESAGPGSVPMQ
jgi:hypothetical protein